MAAANDREEVALSSSELDDVLSSAGLVEGASPTPQDDLELYGVWVKAKPQPVARTRKAAAPAELQDLQGEVVEVAETAELTDDEQDLLAELETETSEEESAQAPAMEIEAEAPIPSLFEETTLSVGGAPEEPSLESLGDISFEEPAPSLDQEIASLDAELTELGQEPSEAEDIGLEAPSLELEPITDLNGIALEEPAAEEAIGVETLPALEEDVSADTSEDMSIDLDEALPSLSDAGDLAIEVQAGSEDDLVLEEPSAGDLELEEPEPARAPGGLQELEAADAHEQETPLGGIDVLPGIDLEDELRPSGPPAAEAGRPDRKPDPAALILEKIESELHAIRREISDLKEELTVLRAEREEVLAPEKAASESAQAGFFGGDEDETIALTGDELDNILSTADITEAKEQEPDELGSETPDILDADILEHAADEPAASVEAPAEGLEIHLREEESEPEVSLPEVPLPEVGDVQLGDESSLLASGLVQDLDLAVEAPEVEGPIVETEVDELAPDLSADLSADLVAEAEAAVAEPRADTTAEGAVPASEEVVLETDVQTEEPFGIELDLGDEAAEPQPLAADEAPEIDLDLSSLDDSLADLPQQPAEEPLVDDLEPSIEVTGIHEAEEPETLLEPEAAGSASDSARAVPEELRDEIKSVLAYLDQLLEALPDEKIEEFAKSEYFGVYKKLFVELGLED